MSHADSAPRRRRLTVVGVDGSACSRAALRWALEDAEDHGATVHAVACYESDGTHRHPVSPAYDEAIRHDVTNALTHVIEAEAVGSPAVEVVQIVLCVGIGGVADALLARAGQGDLLVVGTRGRGGLAGLVLGSVSRRCLEGASTPVVVVPPQFAR